MVQLVTVFPLDRLNKERGHSKHIFMPTAPPAVDIIQGILCNTLYSVLSVYRVLICLSAEAIPPSI